MAIDYKCLGRNPTTQNRRYEILKLLLNYHTPAEIMKITGYGDKQVYNDIQFLNHNITQYQLSLDILRGMGISYYESKIRELESNLVNIKKDSRLWLDTQSKIIDIRDKLMKLQGVYVEKVEHTGNLTFTPVTSDPEVLEAANNLAKILAKQNEL